MIDLKEEELERIHDPRQPNLENRRIKFILTRYLYSE